MRIDADGCELEVTVTGEGPPVVLCHGGPGLWDYLEPLDAFIPGHTVIRYDQRGCGRSDSTEPWTIARYVADLEAIRTSLGFDSWVVGGHSFGADLALRYAVAHPSRATAVLYIAGTGTDWSSFLEAYRVRRDKLLKAPDKARLAELGAKVRDADEEVEFLTLKWMTDYKDLAVGREFAAAMATTARTEGLAVNVTLNAKLNAAYESFDPEQIKGLEMAVLIVQGDRDPRPAACCDELAELLPRATRVVLDKAGHFPWVERPDMFGVVVAGFLAGLG